MDENHTGQKYESFKIPGRETLKNAVEDQTTQQTKSGSQLSLDDGLFYEIDYSSCEIAGVGKFVLKPQKIEPPEKDEIRELFYSMRDIAREHRYATDYSRFYDRNIRQDNAYIFYKQGLFMKDFTDKYSDNVPFSSYFPYYQMMGYEQLRTYFTWRTEVRKGNVAETALSYAFLYLYELLGNIGVDNPQDGLDKLVFFWNAFRAYSKAIDKYVLRWLKDYHIYYGLEEPFQVFAEKNNLAQHYPKMAAPGCDFDLFCSISKYDIRKSAFFTGHQKLVMDCFAFVLNKLRQVFSDNGIQFDEAVFMPTKKQSVWQPFKDALFYPWLKQEDRRVVFSENELYICSQNKWSFSTVITTENGKRLIGYVMKQMEAVLRPLVKYKYKLSADVSTVTHIAVAKLNQAGLSFEKTVRGAVMEFYRESTKTVVSVDYSALVKIREEAFITQEKLIVEEQDEPFAPPAEPRAHSFAAPVAMPQAAFFEESDPTTDVWQGLKAALSETEQQALRTAIHGETDLKQFADLHNVMLEVLIDGINVKAMDFIGDNLFDEAFELYDDYKDNVKEMVE